MGLVVIVLLFAVSTALGAELSVCDLQRPGTSSANIATIKGRLGFTSHGIFLLSEGCKGKAEDAVILFPGTAGTPAVQFTLEGRALSMLGPFMRPAGGTATARAVFRGEVLHKKNLKTRLEGAGPQGNGFGPRGAFSVAVVIESVIEIRSCN